MKKQVTVLMATYNGEKFIEEQLNSILSQKDVIVNVLIRDDGSSDNTCNILKNYKDSNVKVVRGKNLGAAQCFYELISLAEESEYYAFSDQDDIWDNDKLSVGISALEKENFRKPLLYYSGNRMIDSRGNIFEKSTKNRIPSLTFNQALVISNAQGATMVFNSELMHILKKCIPRRMSPTIFHDGWTHKLCLAVGGTAVYDASPHISYRIHENNVLAQTPKKRTLESVFKQLKVDKPDLCRVIAHEMLLQCKDYMDDDNVKLAECVAYYKDSFPNRIKLLSNRNIRTGNLYTDIYFKYKVLIGKA